jgi:hypothetical protein
MFFYIRCDFTAQIAEFSTITRQMPSTTVLSKRAAWNDLGVPPGPPTGLLRLADFCRGGDGVFRAEPSHGRKIFWLVGN